MTTQFYRKGLLKVITGEVNWATDVIKVALVTSAYTPAQTHEFLSNITNELTGYTRPTLDNSIVENTVDDRIDLVPQDVTIASVTTGQTINTLVYFKDTGVATTSSLIGYTTGLSQATNDGGITLDFNVAGLLGFIRQPVV